MQTQQSVLSPVGTVFTPLHYLRIPEPFDLDLTWTI